MGNFEENLNLGKRVLPPWAGNPKFGWPLLCKTSTTKS